MDDMFNMGDEPEKTEPEVKDGKKPCPECGKLLTWTKAGNPRSHKCEPKEPMTQEDGEAVDQSKPEPTGLVAKVIAKFIETKDDLELRSKEFAESVKEDNELQVRRLAFLGEHMKKEGVTSQNTIFGRSEIYKVASATVADPLIFMNWVRSEEEWTFLENRVSKTAVKQRMDDGELIPPGVNYTQIEKVKVVRKSGGK
jgi:hypothetical protein